MIGGGPSRGPESLHSRHGMQSQVRRFLGTALFFVGLILFGTLGYTAIEHWRWHESLYMTVITMTAVGYDEVRPLSGAGRVFTGLIILGGITGLGLWFAFLTSFIVELDLTDVLRRRRSRSSTAQAPTTW